jgi:ubiquinone/menaquinone biosynthesis C-methylase UbiE
MQFTEFAPTLYNEPYKILAQLFDYAVSWEYKPLNLMLVRQFGRPSGWFGRLIGYTMSVEHRPVTEWTLDMMDIQPADHILDIGCGSGMAIGLLAEAAPAGFVAGVDLSETMVKQAIKRNAAAIKAGRVAIRAGDVSRLPYSDQSLDKICGVETFYFWPDPVACLQEVKRVLKPGGRVGLSMEFTKETLTP